MEEIRRQLNMINHEVFGAVEVALFDPINAIDIIAGWKLNLLKNWGRRSTPWASTPVNRLVVQLYLNIIFLVIK